MGVYIANRSKPIHCYDCEDFNNGFECWANDDKRIDISEEYAHRKLHKDCPLTEIDLVRCGECRKWREEDGERFCGISELICSADDFCSYGERRADENALGR